MSTTVRTLTAVLLAALVFLAQLPAPVAAQRGALRELDELINGPFAPRLRGLRRVTVGVQVQDELAALGTSQKALENDLVRALRAANIPVSATGSADAADTGHLSFIIVYDSCLGPNKVLVSMECLAEVRLAHNPSVKLDVPIYFDKHYLEAGSAGPARIRDFALKLADDFARDWTGSSATPRRQAAPPEAQSPPWEAEYVGGDTPPEVRVVNAAARALTLTVAGRRYTIAPGAERSIALEPGTHPYRATAAGVAPLAGQSAFARGYVYTWRFDIVTRPRR